MKKIVLNLVLLVFSFSFIGCTSKEPIIIPKPEFVCFEFEKHSINFQKIEILISENYLNLALARAEELYEAIKFYESQIDRYYEICNKYKLSIDNKGTFNYKEKEYERAYHKRAV